MTSKEVERIASLAKLEFSPDDLERFIPGFEQILGYFELLGWVETDTVEATYHAVADISSGTPLREDVLVDSLPVDEVLRSAPDSKDDQFRVPRVVE